MGVLASAVAAVHGLAVLFMLTGALFALRWPRVLLAHVPVALAILAVNLVGADCPLTDLELALREAAGSAGYDGGFLGHYVFDPLGLDGAASGTQLGIYATALGLNALGYGLLARAALPGVSGRRRRDRVRSLGKTPAESIGPSSTARLLVHGRRR